MPLLVSSTGLIIQGTAEIIEELAAAWQDPADGFGPEADVSDSSTLGRISKVHAGRESAIQAALQTLVLNFDPAVAQGYYLDVLARLNGVQRDPATFAESASGMVITTGATTVPTGAIVRNNRTTVEWEIALDVVAPGAGTYGATIRARAAGGPQDFLSTDSWTIVTPVASWTVFGASLDLAIEDAGTETELDSDLRVKRTDALRAAGNDWEAIQAAVGLVTGVSYVGGLNNTTGGTLDGVPYGAIEAVVEGGDDAAIARAIYDHLPTGDQTFGTTSQAVVMVNGQSLDIFFTRPTPINVWVRITVSTTGAEYAARPTLEDELEAAVLARAQASFSSPGVDVIAGALGGPLWALSADTQTGRPTLTSLIAEISLNGSSWQTTPLVFTHKQRAVFAAARVSVVGL